jgi:hypothetical protein
MPSRMSFGVLDVGSRSPRLQVVDALARAAPLFVRALQEPAAAATNTDGASVARPAE